MEEACWRLLRFADELRHRNPKRAVDVAKSARDLAARSEPLDAGREWLVLQAEAWSVLGSAYRGAADLRRAEAALNVALAFLNARELEHHLAPNAFPRLAQRAAYLRCDQERYDEALSLNEEAMLTYQEIGAAQLLAGSLVDRALILGRSGSLREAIACLVRALERLDPRESQRAYLAAVHNMAFYLHEAGQTREDLHEARKWSALATRQHLRMPEDLNLLKLRMLEGSIAIRLGAHEEGVRQLWSAHDGFERLGSTHHQALVLLRLVSISMEKGETGEVKQIVGRFFPLFKKLKVDHETSEVLMRFYRAVQADIATRDLLDQVIRKMEERRPTRSLMG